MSGKLRQYSEGRRNGNQVQLQASKGTVISTPISRLSLRSIPTTRSLWDPSLHPDYLWDPQNLLQNRHWGYIRRQEIVHKVETTIISVRCRGWECRDSSVGIVPKVRAGHLRNLRSIQSRGKRSCSLSKHPDRVWDPKRLLCNWVSEAFLLGIKRLVLEAKHPGPSGVEAKNEWSHDSALYRLDVSKDNYDFIFISDNVSIARRLAGPAIFRCCPCLDENLFTKWNVTS